MDGKGHPGRRGRTRNNLGRAGAVAGCHMAAYHPAGDVAGVHETAAQREVRHQADAVAGVHAAAAPVRGEGRHQADDVAEAQAAAVRHQAGDVEGVHVASSDDRRGRSVDLMPLVRRSVTHGSFY